MARLDQKAEAHLARRLRSDDVAALGGLYDAYGCHALLVARHICGNETLASESVYAGFRDLWTERQTLSDSVYEQLLRLVHRRALHSGPPG